VKYRSARYRVVVENPDGVNRGVVSADVDGVELTERPLRAPLVDDGRFTWSKCASVERLPSRPRLCFSAEVWL